MCDQLPAKTGLFIYKNSRSDWKWIHRGVSRRRAVWKREVYLHPPPCTTFIYSWPSSDSFLWNRLIQVSMETSGVCLIRPYLFLDRVRSGVQVGEWLERPQGVQRVQLTACWLIPHQHITNLTTCKTTLKQNQVFLLKVHTFYPVFASGYASKHP